MNGTYNIDATGRGTAILNTAKGPVNAAFYPVSPKRAFLVTLDSGSMAHGTLDLQSGSGYSSAALKGNYAIVVSAVDFLDDDTADGRGTTTISNANNGGAMMVFYLLSTQEARVLGTDGAPLLSGNVSQQ